MGELKRRARLSFADGRWKSLGYDWQGRTVQEGDVAAGGPVHCAQKAAGEKSLSTGVIGFSRIKSESSPFGRWRILPPHALAE